MDDDRLARVTKVDLRYRSDHDSGAVKHGRAEQGARKSSIDVVVFGGGQRGIDPPTFGFSDCFHAGR